MTPTVPAIARRSLRVLAALPLLAPAPCAQSPAPGLRLYGPMSTTDTHLVDARGAIVHTWPSEHRPGLGVYLLPDGSLLRAVRTTTGIGAGGGIQRVALDGTVLWDYRLDRPGAQAHHDLEPLPNGNVLLIAMEELSFEHAVAAGRDPALISGPVFRADSLLEVKPTGPTSGVVVWEWHVLDHLVQDFDPARHNFGDVSSRHELIDVNYPADPETSDDWNHVNGIDYDPIHDWVVISAHTQDEIWIIDHGTTTAEAAGHSGGRWGKGGDLLYRWGNPAAYRRGSLEDQELFGQHAPTFIPPGLPGAGHLVVFNNGYTATRSAVFELELPTDPAGRFVLAPGGTYGPAEPVWTFTAPDFFSLIVSSAERLPNGNTLVCSGQQRLLFEVTPAGQRVWEHYDPAGLIFHTHYTEHALWSDAASIRIGRGGTVAFDLIAGTDHFGGLYLVLGSLSGTAPGTPLLGATLPLNRDPLFELTWSAANAAPLLRNTLGVIGGGGRATASFTVPPGRIPAELGGLEMHFAYLVADPASLRVRKVSQPVPVRISR